MTRKTVAATITPPFLVGELDIFGRTMSDANSTRNCAHIELQLEWDDYSVTTALITSVPKDTVRSDKRIADWLAWLTRLSLPEFFNSCHSFCIFAQHDFSPNCDNDVKPFEKLSDVYSAFECNLTPSVSKEIDSNAEHYKAIEAAIRDAKNLLFRYACENTVSTLQYASTDIRRLLEYVESCLRCGIDTGYELNKCSIAQERFEELFRRKQTSHPGFKQSQAILKSALSSIQPPRCWASEPPLPGRLTNLLRRAS